MTEYLTPSAVWNLALAWAAGAVLGGFYFGGLWLTVRSLLRGSRPALWVLASFLLRSGVALGGFYLVSGDSWQRLMACLLGFVMARELLKRLTRPSADAATPAMQELGEARHAP